MCTRIISVDAETKTKGSVRVRSGFAGNAPPGCYGSARPPLEPKIRLKCGDHEWGDPDCDEDKIARKPRPFEHVHQRAVPERCATRVPVSVLQHVIELQNASWKQITCDHHCKPNVQSPERDTDVLFRIRPALVGRHLPKRENHERNREH